MVKMQLHFTQSCGRHLAQCCEDLRRGLLAGVRPRMSRRTSIAVAMPAGENAIPRQPVAGDVCVIRRLEMIHKKEKNVLRPGADGWRWRPGPTEVRRREYVVFPFGQPNDPGRWIGQQEDDAYVSKDVRRQNERASSSWNRAWDFGVGV